MRKILIADPELHYLLKLQTKFFQKLQDSYEIEIISDKNYFERVFSSPQNADCLIINEGWFDSRLEKHNIEHIVLLSDELVSLGAKSADISSGLKIPRHTSIEEIFNHFGIVFIHGFRNKFFKRFVKRHRDVFKMLKHRRVV